eukprot:13355274-Alexandrium_andersonii.AAC.1
MLEGVVRRRGPPWAAMLLRGSAGASRPRGPGRFGTPVYECFLAKCLQHRTARRRATLDRRAAKL